MCLQCLTEAVSYGEVIPGFTLMRATKTHWAEPPYEWEKDQLGLVEMNDPSFVLTKEPVKDPLFERDLDSISNEEYDLHESESNVLYDTANVLSEDILKSSKSVMSIYHLVDACKQAGYDEKKHGSNFTAWLSHYLAAWIETHQPIPHNAEEE